MSTHTPVEANARRVRIALSLVVTSSVLQCALLFGIYELHPHASVAYLLTVVSCLPIFAMAILAGRTRSSSPDTFLRSYLVGTVFFAASLVATSFLIVTLEVLFFPRSLSMAALLASLPLALAIVPASLLVIPKRMTGGQSLGESLLPVRIKLATPAIRFIFRMLAIVLVYFACDFASRLLLNSNILPQGLPTYAIALLPVLPIFGLIPIYNKYMAEEQDEFQRHLFNQSILWAALGTLMAVCAMERIDDYALIIHRHFNLFRLFSPVLIFYFLQLEAGFVIKAIHAARMKRNQ